MKKFVIITLIMCIFFCMYSVTFADYGFGGNSVTPQAPTGEAANIAPKIIGAMQWIGYAIAVGMLVFIGIKYVMASANEKADLKSALVKYVVGAVLIVFAVTLAGWVFSLNGGSSGGGTSGSGTSSTTSATTHTNYVRD